MKDWFEILAPVLNSKNGKKVKAYVKERREKTTVYPQSKDVFNAFHYCPFSNVKIIIIGQDPYHDGSAHGLAFSSLKRKTPASLKNIFKEMQRDLYPYAEAKEIFQHSNLKRWAEQGVLLLNTCLTVEAGDPESHSNIGWQEITSYAIDMVSRRDKAMVFMLWGAHAQKMKKYIEKKDTTLILETSHPSPFSVGKGFSGCGHFSDALLFLSKHYPKSDGQIDASEFFDYEKAYKHTRATVRKNGWPAHIIKEFAPNFEKFKDQVAKELYMDYNVVIDFKLIK